MTDRRQYPAPPRRPSAQAPARGAARPSQAARRPATTRPLQARRSAASSRRGAGLSGWLGVPDHRYSAVKLALLALLAAFTVWIVGVNSARDVEFGAIARRVEGASGLDELHAMDENAFQERLGTAPEGCEGWLLYGSDEVMNVDELLIAKGGEAALDRLQDAAEARVAAQLDVFRSYGVDQKQLLEDAALLRRGGYLFYAVGEHAADWEDAFLSAIR